MPSLLLARIAKSFATRHALLLAALATLPLGAGCVHVAVGRSLAPYQGRSLHPTDEFRLGFTLPQLPQWAFAYAAGGAKGPRDSASFFVPTCVKGLFEVMPGTPVTGCHPDIPATSDAFEVQYRWNHTRSVHPLASVALGRVETGYDLIRGKGIRFDSAQSSRFVTVGGGGELNLARWLHVTAIAGYRQSFGRSNTVGIAMSSGFTLTSLLVVGTLYRDR